MNRLRRKTEITRDVRMHASRRCYSRHRASIYLVSTLSTGVILLSLLPNTLTNVSDQQNQILLSSSIVFSIFIIFTSAIDAMTNFFYRARIFQNNGEKLAALLYDLNFSPLAYAPTPEVVKTFADRYEAAVRDLPFNHDYVDFLAVRIGKSHLFPRRYSKYRPMRAIQKTRDRLTLYFRKFTWIIPSASAVIIVGIVVWKLVLPES
ncbi:SLATT domain-containing protein [Pontixanthobacter aestiaquae]|nr:SLATT domain-containing protein [Pontixanthobacter aestiaquae]MDN3645785.1 SLATT domain-containing protein [Pontixanthobacter aestiaquae]